MTILAASVAPTIVDSSSAGSGNNKLSTTDLAAIIGGSAGGLLVITVATVLCCIRKRKQKRAQKEYDLGRGISASKLFNQKETQQVQQSIQQGTFFVIRIS